MLRNLLSRIYGFFVGKRNDNFDSSDNIVRCKVPVISVGNLSVGGTGKTPFVQMLTKYFLSKGFNPIDGKGTKERQRRSIVGDASKCLSQPLSEATRFALADSLKVPVNAHDLKHRQHCQCRKNSM